MKTSIIKTGDLYKISNELIQILKQNKNHILIQQFDLGDFQNGLDESEQSFINSSFTHSKKQSSCTYNVRFTITDRDWSCEKENKKALENLIELSDCTKTPILDISYGEVYDNHLSDVMTIFNSKIFSFLPNIFPTYFVKITRDISSFYVDGKQVCASDYHKRVQESNEHWKEHPTFVR